MKHYIILVLLFISFGCKEPAEDKRPPISSITIGDTYILSNYSTKHWKEPKISYANEYTTTYVFEETGDWNWLYITVNNDNKVTKIRTKYQKMW